MDRPDPHATRYFADNYLRRQDGGTRDPTLTAATPIPSDYITMPSDVISWTTMLMVYADNSEISKAREMFEQMPMRNAASWNTTISAYARDPKLLKESYELFSAMSNKNSVTYAAIVTGFSRGGMLLQAEKVYWRMPPRLPDLIDSNALISGYLRVGEIEKAVQVFTWSSMFDGYWKNGMVLEARPAFEGWSQKYALSAVPHAYVILTVLGNGLMVQGCAIHHGFEPFFYVSNGSLNMNARCGDIKSASKVFDEMKVSEVGCENDLHSSHLSCTDQFKEPSKYAWSDFCDDQFIVSYQRVVLVTSKRVMLLQSLSLEKLDRKPSKIGWEVPWEELLALELAKASPSKPSHLIIHLKHFRKSEGFVQIVRCNIDEEEGNIENKVFDLGICFPPYLPSN